MNQKFDLIGDTQGMLQSFRAGRRRFGGATNLKICLHPPAYNAG
jgi:hypothetical protein